MITLLIVAIALIGLAFGVVDTSHLFPAVEDAKVGIKDKNTRAFAGTGGNLLMLPGCREVHSVRVGDTHLPATIAEQYPVAFDSNGVPTLETHDVPLYQLIDTADGPALQRSMKSNDVVWQAGVPVYVSGAWGEAKAAKPADEEAEAKKKAEAEKAAAQKKAEAEAEAKKKAEGGK